MVIIRGIFIKPDTQKYLTNVVKDLVERNLAAGNEIKLSASDLVKMARSGGYILPKNLDLNDTLSLYGYCGHILYDLHPNHGSVKREEIGVHICYKFTPDIPQKGVVQL